MDDPIFERWFIESGDQRPSPPRWRSPTEGTAPRPPASGAAGKRIARPADHSPEEESSSSGSLVTAMATLERITRRLQLARHDAHLEHLAGPSAVRLRMRLCPWTGPLVERVEAVRGTLEVTAEGTTDNGITVRYGLDGHPETSTEVVLDPRRSASATVLSIATAFVEMVFAAAGPFDG